MKQFHKILINLSRKLDVPQPKKSRILQEIAADMEDMYDYHIQSGFSMKESLKAVEENYTFSDESISELINIHEPLMQRIFNKLQGQIKTRTEKISLMILMTIIAVSAFYAMVMTPFFKTSSTMIWPVLGIGFYAITLSCIKFYRLFTRTGKGYWRMRSGLSKILFLEGLVLFISMWGYFYEYLKNGPLIPTSSLISLVFFGSKSMIHVQLIQISQCLIKSSSVMITGLLLFIIIAALLYMIIWKIQKIELAETMKYLNQ